MSETPGEILPQPGLKFVGGREAGVAAFGRTGDVGVAVPDEERLAQAGPRRDHGDRSVRFGFAEVDAVPFARQEMRHGIGDRLQVVQQHDAPQPEALAQRRFVHLPGQVGEMRATADHRPGDVEAGMVGGAVLPGQEFARHRVQAGIVGTVVLGLRDGRTGAGRGGVQRQQGLGPADIAGQQHPSVSPGLSVELAFARSDVGGNGATGRAPRELDPPILPRIRFAPIVAARAGGSSTKSPWDQGKTIPRICRLLPRDTGFAPPQHEFLYLTRRRLRKLVDEADPLRCLEVGQIVAHVKLEFFLGRFGTVSQDDEGMRAIRPTARAACRRQRLPAPPGGATGSLRPRPRRCFRRR